MGKGDRGGKDGRANWEIVNREKKKWKGINKEIKMEEWNGYFRNLLGGVEGKVVMGGRTGRVEEEEMELEREEIKRVVARLKDRKAMGLDGPTKHGSMGERRLGMEILQQSVEARRMAGELERRSNSTGKEERERGYSR